MQGGFGGQQAAFGGSSDPFGSDSGFGSSFGQVQCLKYADGTFGFCVPDANILGTWQCQAGCAGTCNACAQHMCKQAFIGKIGGNFVRFLWKMHRALPQDTTDAVWCISLCFCDNLLSLTAIMKDACFAGFGVNAVPSSCKIGIQQ